MKVLKNKRKDFTVALEIKADVENMPDAMDRAFKNIVKDVKIQGFRKGKVPRGVFEKTYGKEVLIQDAVNFLVDDAYRGAIEELELKIVDYPKNIDVDPFQDGKDLTFRCEVDVEPEVKLGKYKGIKASKQPAVGTAEQLDEEINKSLEQYAGYEEADKASEDTDIIQMNMTASIDGEEYGPWTRENAGSRIGMANYGPDFDKEVTGMKKGDKKEFKVTIPEDFAIEDLREKEVAFEVELLSVRSKTLPELTDEFVKEKIENFDTVKDFKASIQERLDAQAKQAAEQEERAEVLKKIVDDVNLEIPEAMVRSECDRQLRYFEQTLMQSGLSLQQYMDMTKKTIDDMRADVKEQAASSLKTQLVLQAISAKEKIEATDEDCNEEIAKWNHETVKNIDDLKANPQLDFESLKLTIVERKTVDFVMDNAKIK